MLLLRSKYIRGEIKVEAETKSKIWEYVGWGAIVIVGAIATFGGYDANIWRSQN
ncbi:hypothetical protein ACQKOI_14095 [Bacillus paramycoides]